MFLKQPVHNPSTPDLTPDLQKLAMRMKSKETKKGK